jgi:hypothetical protein
MPAKASNPAGGWREDIGLKSPSIEGQKGGERGGPSARAPVGPGRS